MVFGALWRRVRLGMYQLRIPGPLFVSLILLEGSRLTPLSTTASEPTRTRSTRSMMYPTALSNTTVHGIPLAVRIWCVFILLSQCVRRVSTL